MNLDKFIIVEVLYNEKFFIILFVVGFFVYYCYWIDEGLVWSCIIFVFYRVKDNFG